MEYGRKPRRQRGFTPRCRGRGNRGQAGRGESQGNYANHQSYQTDRNVGVYPRDQGLPGNPRCHGRRGPILGFKRLENLRFKSADEITNELLHCKDSFKELISSEMKDDWIFLLVHVLAEMCKSQMKENINELLSLLKDSRFLQQTLVEYILNLPYDWDSFSEEELKGLLQSLTSFFKAWLSKFPTSGLRIPLDQFWGSLKKMESNLDLKNFISQVETFLEMRDQELQEQKKQQRTGKEKRVLPKPRKVEEKPPEDFHALPVEPTDKEITCSQLPFLRKNKVSGKYEDLDHYLDVQFRLLREDFIGPLREGIKEITENRQKGDRQFDLSTYTDVQVMNPVFTSSGMVYKIRFCSTVHVSKIEFWQHSKRLLFGSFLCLSNDNFKTLIFASVANRKPEDLAKGFLEIRFISGEEGLPQVLRKITESKFVLVESPAYFESYRHVLRRLQEITSENFPFQDYLVSCSPIVQAPVYLRDPKLQGTLHYDLKEALVITSDKVNANVEVLNPRAWPSENMVELNNSQLEAVEAALTKEFVVIQGPPGTGKTYVGLKIVRALLDNRVVWDPEGTSCMLMVCYTNHALDQFLEGVLDFLADGVVRVGGRSKSEILASHNIHEMTKSSDGQRTVYRETKEYHEELEKCRQVLEESRQRILSLDELQDSMGSIHRKHLNLASFEYQHKGISPVEGWLGLTRLTRIPTGRENKERELPTTGKPNAALNREHRNILKGEKIYPMSQIHALQINDIWTLSIEQRWALYLYWLRLFQFSKQEDIKRNTERHENACKRLAEVRGNDELKVLSRATVIGMTTTGAAKYSKLLEEIKPRIVVVEEAAEVLEAHIITSLTQGTQHLILIGDHKQLRPNPTCYELARNYNLDFSLFERMVNGGMKCESLTIQHRMRPEISSSLRHIYSNLQDHKSVEDYEDVLGVNHNMYFIDHNVFEDNNETDARLKSYSNKHEARYMVALCEYFLHQGYDRDKITILTMYTGQLLALRKLMPKERFEGVRVTAVDNFQGEENDIILLSLVRSNDKGKIGKIGFLGVDNRICVALSRARVGLFCIGNFSMLARKSKLWKVIVDEVKERGAIGEGLKLICRNHPEREVYAKTMEDFQNAPQGGCLQPCFYRLACGHGCESVCHPTDPKHEFYKCRKDCIQDICAIHNTKCNTKCHYGTPCEGCDVKVAKESPVCGHVIDVPCGTSVDTFPCQESCRLRFDCGHPCPDKCYEKCKPNNCKVQVTRELDCGHTATGDCPEIRSESYECQEPCGGTLQCGHLCAGTCSSCVQGRMHIDCTEPCQRILVCQHRCTEPCVNNCPPCTNKCENRCIHSRCPLKCQEPCTSCKEMCTWECQPTCGNGYYCDRLCGERCSRPRCDTPCSKLLRCQHKCIGLCGEPCPALCLVCNKDEVTEIFFGSEEDEDARFIELLDCGHVYEVSGMDSWMSVEGDEDQVIQLKFCPKCKTPVRRSFRYADLVKAKLQDIEKVKEIKFKEESMLKHKVSKLSRSINTLAEKFPEIERHTGTERDEDLPFNTIDRWLQQRRTITELGIIKNQLLLLEGICKLRKEAKQEFGILPKIDPYETSRKSDPEFNEMRANTLREIHAKLRALQDTIMVFQVTQQALKDTRDELSRVGLKMNLRKLQRKVMISKTSLKQSDKDILERIENQLKNGGRMSEEEEKKVADDIRNVGERNGVLAITHQERIMVLSAMKFGSTGHWYKCPNNHIYAIGECGGANQEARCPECNSQIGGQSHRLAEGNKLATEMDGAQHSAWSEQNNLENFDPAELRRLQFE